MNTIRFVAAPVLVLATGAALRVTQAQPTGIKRTDVEPHALGLLGHEVIQVARRHCTGSGVRQALTSWAGARLCPRRHTGVSARGQTTGDAQGRQGLYIPAGTIHAAKNVGSGNGAEIARYVVEKGKPLVVMVK